MNTKHTLIGIFLLAVTSLFAQEISDTSFGKGLINFTAKDSSFSIKFAPRFQMRSVSSWDYDGDKYGNGSPFSRLAFYENIATEVPDDPVYNSQTETGPFPGFFGGKIWIKNFFEYLGFDAATGIRNPQHGMFSG